MKIYTKDGVLLAEVLVDDNSYRNRTIMGDNALTIYFSAATHIEIPLGAYVEYQGERYTLTRPEALKMQHSRCFEYTVTMESVQSMSKIWKFRNPVDGRLKFSLTAKPKEHLQMFVDNMNIRDTGWVVGSCVDGVDKCINYDHAYCWDALGQMADEYDTEFEIVGKTVSLRKVEYNKDNPLPLSYGRGNGFVSGVGRSNQNDKPPIERLYAQGGSRNIDPSKYGASDLHLPCGGAIKYDGDKFEGEEGYDESKARTYVADEKGYSIRCLDKTPYTLAEDSLDCSDIYPKRVGKVTEVICMDAEKHFYDIIDNTIPETLNYEECLIAGETMTIIFQSGMLSGKEFEVRYFHDADSKDDFKGRRFEIVPQEIDGQIMPNETFKPVAADAEKGIEGDTYAVFNCYLPPSYINAGSDMKEGAEWDMMRECVRYLREHEEENFTFTGTMDGIWARKNWANVGGRIVLGGYVLFTDERFQKDGALIRIIGIKDYINQPHSPELELSNSTVSSSFGTKLQTLESTEVMVADRHKDALQYTKRRWRDAKETLTMLEQAFLDNFTESVSPISVQTMAMLVGDESLQFRFVDSKDTPQSVALNIAYDNATKRLHCPAAILQHMTLGIDSISPSHAAGDYRFWDIAEFTSGDLKDGAKRYYLYAKVTKDAAVATGEFMLSEQAVKMETDSDANHFYFLVGILNSEYDGDRSFVPLYGFTEILPGRITTDKVVSSEGNSYFDLVANSLKLGDALDFNSSGDGKLLLKGTIVQSQSGVSDVIGCFRGEYDPTVKYYNGDEVTYPVEDCISTFRYIHKIPTKGVRPTDLIHWQVIAQGSEGQAGERGADGKSPALVFRGDYSTDATYYGTEHRVDCVRYNGAYYVTRVDAGEVKLIAPTDTTAWRPFGATFDSVATSLLLAENANIAGWLFRNGRMESQTAGSDGNPMAYLDGTKGEMRLNGVIQLSTSYSGGNITDSNLFCLPAATVGKFITLRKNVEDIGKVIRLYNSSSFGKGVYKITGCKFDTAGAETLTFQTDIRPQETIELTCFERASAVDGVRSAEWVITGRFGHESTRAITAVGTFPRVVAMGVITGSNTTSPSFNGHLWDGTDAATVFTVTWMNTGVFTVTFAEGTLPNGYMIFITGRGICKGSVTNQSSTGFTLYVSNGSTWSNSDVNIMILDPQWYYSPNQNSAEVSQ